MTTWQYYIDRYQDIDVSADGSRPCVTHGWGSTPGLGLESNNKNQNRI